jgi:dTDP-4-amino-4,6-dideoxygalactose transaminase
MSTIIGGMFGLNIVSDERASSPPFLAQPHILLATARSGIAYLIDHLIPANIWMPSYLCDVMLLATRGSKVNFYPVNANLQIASDWWVRKVKPKDLIVFIDYFGFPTQSEFIDATRLRGAWVLEDASQALLSTTTHPSSDFIIYSPRKFIGVPDGGILVINNPAVSLPDHLPGPHPEWWPLALRASYLRHEFDMMGGERVWFDIYQKVDAEGPVNPYRMSDLSEILLRNFIDYSFIVERRRNNYTTLLERLGEYALFPLLPEGVVPLGFPVCLKNREQVRQFLFKQKIYPPVHWPIKDVVPDSFQESHRLSDQILTLICDQRYDFVEMELTATLLLQVAEELDS